MPLKPITPKSLQTLRDCSGAGLSDCRAALQRTGGSLAKAVMLLEKEGRVPPGRVQRPGWAPPDPLDKAFPPCPFEGAVDPVPFAHMASAGNIPKKCDGCRYLFEGECTRAGPDDIYMALDHGPCPVGGPTDPVEVTTPLGMQWIPRKCVDCRHRRDHASGGKVCRLDENVWGDFARSFDWGDWRPEEDDAGTS